jgi:hypothetical protein
VLTGKNKENPKNASPHSSLEGTGQESLQICTHPFPTLLCRTETLIYKEDDWRKEPEGKKIYLKQKDRNKCNIHILPWKRGRKTCKSHIPKPR